MVLDMASSRLSPLSTGRGGRVAKKSVFVSKGSTAAVRIASGRRLAEAWSIYQMRIASLLAFVGAAALVASPALAHPKLVSATPAENTAVTAPKALQLHFSEELVAKLSGADLFMTEMPGMKMGQPMAIGGVKAALGADGKTLILSLAKPLTAGTYRVAYHIVSKDTHRIEGGYVFNVK